MSLVANSKCVAWRFGDEAVVAPWSMVCHLCDLGWNPSQRQVPYILEELGACPASTCSFFIGAISETRWGAVEAVEPRGEAALMV